MDYIVQLLPSTVREAIIAVYTFKELLGLSLKATENYGGGLGGGVGGAVGGLLGSLMGNRLTSSIGGAFGGMIGGATGSYKMHHSNSFTFCGGLGAGMCAWVFALVVHTGINPCRRAQTFSEAVYVAVGGGIGGAYGGFFGPITGIPIVYKFWRLAQIGSSRRSTPGLSVSELLLVIIIPLYQIILLGSLKTTEDVFTKYNQTLSRITDMEILLDLNQ